MAASLGGVDQIALSGGIGANDPELLSELQEGMAWLGPVGVSYTNLTLATNFRVKNQVG